MSAGEPVHYADSSETCDTRHAHTQVLGKLAAALAVPEPQLQHEAFVEHSAGGERRFALARGRSVGKVTRELSPR